MKAKPSALQSLKLALAKADKILQVAKALHVETVAANVQQQSRQLTMK